jgi:hypothetical protein
MGDFNYKGRKKFTCTKRLPRLNFYDEYKCKLVTPFNGFVYFLLTLLCKKVALTPFLLALLCKKVALAPFLLTLTRFLLALL